MNTPHATPALVAAVFDAYGTLFDVHSIAVELERHFPRKGAAISRTWRERQIDYTRLRTLSQRYVPFTDVTRDALRYACRLHAATLAPEIEQSLMDGYLHLAPHPEAHDAVAQVRALGLRCAILTNGDSPMIEAVVKHAGFEGVFDDLISVDVVRQYKTAAPAYQLAVDRMHCEPSRILFVSSNGWDACGATWFGFTTCWINRANAPAEELGVHPHHEGRTLHDVVAYAMRLLNA